MTNDISSGQPAPASSSFAKSTISRIAFLDANILFSPRLRDIFIHLHTDAEDARGGYAIYWSSEVDDEWRRNVALKQPNANSLERCIIGMRNAVPDWEVVDYKKFVNLFESINIKDQHVAAAAYKLSIDYDDVIFLVTKNIKDFPSASFQDTMVRVSSPGDYLEKLYLDNPSKFLDTIEGCLGKLKNPPLSRGEYLDMLVTHGCHQLVSLLKQEWLQR